MQLGAKNGTGDRHGPPADSLSSALWVMTGRQDSAKGRITAEDLKQILSEDRDLLKVIVEEVWQ
jgi:hypothetical protein